MIKKRGLSGVISVVIIIALVMAAVVLVWNFVENTITDQIENTESCYNARQELSFDNDYTCYNITHDSGEIRVKIDRGDVDIDGALISIKSESETISYEINSEARELNGITNYPEREGTIILPGKDQGRTYIIRNLELNNSFEDITSLRLSLYPIIGDDKCEKSDSINNLYDCSVFN